jgi:chondroitin 4-sulfotransferase 11
MINHEHKCIFIHINKCAGFSIDYFFNDRFCGHDKAIHYKNKYPKEFKEYFKFTIVRNPWDRMLSFYLYQKKRCWDFYPFSAEKAPPFNEFICKYLKRMPKQTRLNTKPCYDWIHDKNDNLLIPEIVKFEELQHRLPIVFKKINKDGKLKKLNSTEKKHYSEYYNQETREIIEKRFKKDIELFNYKYETP